jgi:hypothetical protein
VTLVFEAIHLDTAPAQPVDPALAAIGAFHSCRERFEAAIEAKERVEGDLLAMGLGPDTPELEQARASLRLSALDESERSLGEEHDATLAAALATTPTSVEGVTALAELLADQSRQGVPAAMLTLGSISVDAAISRISAVSVPCLIAQAHQW